jgi:succinoglycan biosynthesis protein ExoV
MKLYYYQDPKGNFGDDLNPWLWSKLMPEVLDDNPEAILVGIGSILDHWLPTAPMKHVLGSGVGYGRLPIVDEKFVFHAVRGYATAAELRLPSNLVITDAAVMLHRIVDVSKLEKSHEFGFMPSGHSERHYDWEKLCKEVGFNFISCHWSVDKVIDEIGKCKVLISEAMHGAIAADSLRVPWIPLMLDDTVLPFKWKDWLSTLDLPYEPVVVTPIYDNKRIFSVAGQLKNRFKFALNSRGIWSSRWSDPLPLTSPASVRPMVQKQLHALVNKVPYLSNESLIESHVLRYENVIEKLKRAYGR